MNEFSGVVEVRGTVLFRRGFLSQREAVRWLVNRLSLMSATPRDHEVVTLYRPDGSVYGRADVKRRM